MHTLSVYSGSAGYFGQVIREVAAFKELLPYSHQSLNVITETWSVDVTVGYLNHPKTEPKTEPNTCQPVRGYESPV